MMKTREDNDVINRKCPTYAEKDNELSWLIGLGADFDENQIRQLHDWS